MRNIALDILKIILAVMVVFLHSRLLSEYYPKTSYVLVQGLFRMAVPTFFIINGFFFFRVTNAPALSNWLKKTLLLYLLWMLIYAPLWFTGIFSEMIESITVGYYHLWYIKAMILCGIIVYAVRNWNSTVLMILAVSLFVIGVMTQYLINYEILMDYPDVENHTRLLYVHRNFLFLGLPFFAFGYLVRKEPPHLKTWIIKALTLLSITLLLAESYTNSMFTDREFDNLFLLGLACPLVFLYVSKLKANSSFNGKTIALYSTAIYLIHPWIMTLLDRNFQIEPTHLSLLTVLISLPASLLVIRISEKYKLFLL